MGDNVGHKAVCEYVAKVKGWSPADTHITSASKCDYTAENEEGLVLMEGEGLSAEAKSGPLHIKGHLTHFLGFSRETPVAEIVWVIVKEEEKGLLEKTFEEWFKLMADVKADLRKMPKMRIVMLDIKALEKIKDGKAGNIKDIVDEKEIKK